MYSQHTCAWNLPDAKYAARPRTRNKMTGRGRIMGRLAGGLQDVLIICPPATTHANAAKCPRAIIEHIRSVL